MILAIGSVLTLYLGLLNTFLARYAGTCTQDDAARLWGILLSAPLFLLTALCLARTKHLGGAMIACLPGLLLMLWQGAFAIELSFGILVQQLGACEILERGPYGYDGHEITFAILWPAVMFGALGAIAMVYVIRRSRASRQPKIQS